MDELYFCLHLTENEHDIVEHNIKEESEKLGLELKYYRRLKDGHVPMYREVKVVGPKLSINQFKAWMKTEYIDLQVERNPHCE